MNTHPESQVFCFNGDWSVLGGAASLESDYHNTSSLVTDYGSMAVSDFGDVYLSYMTTNSASPRVIKYNQGSWLNLTGDLSGPMYSNSLCLRDGVLYLAYVNDNSPSQLILKHLILDYVHW